MKFLLSTTLFLPLFATAIATSAQDVPMAAPERSIRLCAPRLNPGTGLPYPVCPPSYHADGVFTSSREKAQYANGLEDLNKSLNTLRRNNEITSKAYEVDRDIVREARRDVRNAPVLGGNP